MEIQQTTGYLENSVKTAQSKLTRLWQTGDLFHNFRRFPARPDVPRVDRLAKALSEGLLAPAESPESVPSDLRMTVTGLSIPYDSVVFLHRRNETSGLYIPTSPGVIAILIRPDFPVLTKEDMGKFWPLMCQDEVYVKGRIPKENFSGVAVHPCEAKQLWDEFGQAFERLSIPLYTFDGVVVWPTNMNF